MKNEEYTSRTKDGAEKSIEKLNDHTAPSDTEQTATEYTNKADDESATSYAEHSSETEEQIVISDTAHNDVTKDGEEAKLDEASLPLLGLEEYGETSAYIDEDLLAYHNAENIDSTEVISDEDDLEDDAENEDYPEDAESDYEIDEEDVSIEEDEENDNIAVITDSGEPKPRRIDAIFDFIEVMVFSIIGVFLLLSFFFRYTIVDGGSMMNTLQNGDRLILTSFLYEPECGDIVVIQDKSTVLKDPIVKRIIATEGQTVKFTHYAVYVDGVKLDEPYVYTADYENALGQPEAYRYSIHPHDSLLEYVIEDNDNASYSVTVPEGMVFVMGDHRNNSKDSREIGMIHEDAIIGKAIYRFFPFESFGKID